MSMIALLESAIQHLQHIGIGIVVNEALMESTERKLNMLEQRDLHSFVFQCA